MRIAAVEGTPLFAGPPRRPEQIVRVTVAGEPPSATAPSATPVLVRVAGAGVTTRQPFGIENLLPGTERVAEVPVTVAAPHRPGSRLPVTVIAESPQARAERAERAERAAEITVAEPGWTIWMVCHFHYDPVWWDTQGEFTQTRLAVPGADGELPDSRSAFELVRLHLRAARADPDYKFVLAEIDYLKPYFDTHPEDRAYLRELIAGGRVEIVGGAYNEPNTNLTSAESTIRNIVYGTGHQRDVLGADPSVAWALDAFGHDPSYPGLMAAAGMTGSAWARGPYHQWGPWRTVGDNRRMQFPSEFEWISPDGTGLLTSYMANHYGAGWGIHQAPDLAAAAAEALAQFVLLAPVAATRNVLLPVGADHVIPARWATAVHRHFAARYAWPRCVTGLPREFFAAVRAEAAERGMWLTPQTRDMNPVYPGKDVSYVDTKQAQRAAEVAVSDAERLATLAWLAGAEYPAESLDKAWRQLVFGAHHDAITGTESDQVYLDLLGGWREAFERGDSARREAARFLAGLSFSFPPNGYRGASPSTPADRGGGAGQEAGSAVPGPAARPVTVFNTLSWPRAGLATITLAFGEPGTGWLAIRDDAGARVPFLAEGVRRHADGSLAAVTVTFRAQVPALGYRTYWAEATEGAGGAGGAEAGGAGWAEAGGTEITNETFLVRADPSRGGTLSRIVDRRTGTDLLRGPGNELVLQDEYDQHPRWGEGPWLLSPKGPGTGSAAVAARVRAERCPVGSRLVAGFTLGGLVVRQETLLWDGIDLVEFRTHVDGSIGHDRLLRVRFGVGMPGGLPVYQGAGAVVGRPFGTADADVAKHAFTLDNPAHEWFGAGSTARVTAGELAWAIGVAEVIVPGPGGPAPGPAADAGWRAAVRDLVAALARAGVTATCTHADGPRYGGIDLDSNVPDCRIVLGGPDDNAWAGRLLAALGRKTGADVAAKLSAPGTSLVWVPAARPRAEVFGPSPDVRAERELPALIVSGSDLTAAVTRLTRDLADAVIEADLAVGGPDADRLRPGHTVALLNKGTPSSLVTPDGTLYVSLMRSSSAWPSGVWIDGERRTAPDGSSFAWQHWSHTFSYALAAGRGDWRDAGLVVAGQEFNHDLIACETGLHAGPLPGSVSLCEVAAPPEDALPGGPPRRPGALLSALKPRGNPLASGKPGRPRREDGLSVRLRDGGALPGGPVPADVRLFTGIAAGHVTDLREDADGPPLPVADGRARATVPPAGMVTLALHPGTAGPAEPGTPAAPEPGTSALAGRGAPGLPEPVQPVFTRYWLPGKGPAPAGNLPVTVHLSPDRITLGSSKATGSTAAGGPDQSAGLRVSVACGPEGAAGQVVLDVPPGLSVTGPGGGPAGPLSYSLSPGSLPPGGHTSWDLSVRALPGADPGRYFVAAQITDYLGQVLEDAALVTVGEPPPPPLSLPLGELQPLLAADQRARAAEVSVSLRPGALEASPGEPVELSVQVTNHTRGPVRGESQLISPFGSWDAIRPWTLAFAAGPGETAALAYRGAVPPDARPGSHWWVLAKVTYFGRVHYTESIPVRVRG